MAADAPQFLTLKRNRDLDGRRVEHPIRWALLGLVAAVLVLALFNTFGQRPEVDSAVTDRAQLDLFAPNAVRGGLIFETRITIHALKELKDARVVLDHGWTEGITINTIEPSPVGEASDNGRVSLDLGHIPAAGEYVLYLQMSVNPTNVSRKKADVRLFDGDSHVLTIHHTLTSWP